MIGRHESYFKSLDRQTLHLPDSGEEVTLEKDELLNIEWSYKVRLATILSSIFSIRIATPREFENRTSFGRDVPASHCMAIRVTHVLSADGFQAIQRTSDRGRAMTPLPSPSHTPRSPLWYYGQCLLDIWNTTLHTAEHLEFPRHGGTTKAAPRAARPAS